MYHSVDPGYPHKTMFLRQFQYLIALEREGHFGRAAERCYVSQPSLSSAIKKLEEELGVPIILRDQKFQGFPNEGKRVVEWARRLLADRAAMFEELAIMQKILHGNLRVGAMPTSSPMLPIVARLFRQHYPEVQIDIQFMGIDQLTLALKNFELDIAFSDLDQIHDARLETLPLYEEPLHLLLPNNDWLDDAPEVDWTAAAELPLCLLSQPSREREIMNNAFASVNCQPQPQLESNSIFQLAFHVMAGDLATIVPKRFTELPGTRDKQLVNPVVTQKLGLVWVGGDPILPMARATIELLNQALVEGVFDYASK
jgi:DNA-binding transcriptional LysR family regulator